jgi:hypothetical protein
MRDGEVGVNEQIRSLVSTLYDQSPSLMFDDTKVAENYIIGFLGFQLKKTSERRKKWGPVRSILEYICTNHFISPSTAAYKEMIRKIRDDGCPTGLIDRRISAGKLQYPTTQCWKVFATVETVYHSLVRPDNFIIS